MNTSTTTPHSLTTLTLLALIIQSTTSSIKSPPYETVEEAPDAEGVAKGDQPVERLGWAEWSQWSECSKSVSKKGIAFVNDKLTLVWRRSGAIPTQTMPRSILLRRVESISSMPEEGELKILYVCL